MYTTELMWPGFVERKCKCAKAGGGAGPAPSLRLLIILRNGMYDCMNLGNWKCLVVSEHFIFFLFVFFSLREDEGKVWCEI